MNEDQLKQWQQLIENYGEGAYLMVRYKKNYEFGVSLWYDAISNDFVDSNFKDTEFEFKQSAALPFDLERALNGDDIECNFNGLWVYGKLHLCDGESGMWITIHQYKGNKFGRYFEVSKLRMKYPSNRNAHRTEVHQLYNIV